MSRPRECSSTPCAKICLTFFRGAGNLSIHLWYKSIVARWGIRRVGISRMCPGQGYLGGFSSRWTRFRGLFNKSLCLGRPSYLATLFNKNQSRTSGRAPRDIEVPSSRTDTGLNSFSAQGARLWNSFPQSIRTLLSFARLKSAMCEFLHSSTLSLWLKLYR